MAASFGFGYIRRPDLARQQEERQPALRLRPHQRRVPGHPRRRLRAAAATSWPRRCPTWTTRRSRSSRRPQFFRDSPGADLDRERRGRRSRRCSTGRCRSPGTGSARPSASGPPRSTGGPRWSRRAARRSSPTPRTCTPGSTCAGPAGPCVYLPVVLSAGICPDNLDAFVRQQYRWCTGNAGIVFSRRLWSRPDEHPGPAHLHLRVLLLRLHRPADLLRAAHPGRHAGVPARPGPAAELRHPAPGRDLPASSCTRCGTSRAYGPAVWPLGIARGWAHVFAIWDGARGKTMSWHPTRTPGSALRRFRLGVTWWSGGLALLWTVAGRSGGRLTLDSPAVRGPAALRPAQPGRGQPRHLPRRQARMRGKRLAASRTGAWPLAMAVGRDRLAADHRPAAGRCRGRLRVSRSPRLAWAAVARDRLPPSPASYLGVFEHGAPPGYQPVASFAQAAGPAAEHRRLLQRLGAAVRRLVRPGPAPPRRHPVRPDRPDRSPRSPAIASGAYDDLPESYADSVRDFGHAGRSSASGTR